MQLVVVVYQKLEGELIQVAYANSIAEGYN